MILTIVGMGILILSLYVRVWMLGAKLRNVQTTAADAIDAQTTLYIKLDSRLKAVEYPKYMGTLTGSQIGAEDAACDGIDPVWGEHDKAVADTLTAARQPMYRTNGAINTNPESSAFFEDAEDKQ